MHMHKIKTKKQNKKKLRQEPKEMAKFHDVYVIICSDIFVLFLFNLCVHLVDDADIIIIVVVHHHCDL